MLLQLFEVRLGMVTADDKLLRLLVRDAVLGAALVHELAPAQTEPCLERVGGIVEASVNDLAVARAGLSSPNDCCARRGRWSSRAIVWRARLRLRVPPHRHLR